jgi:hypothetical protein
MDGTILTGAALTDAFNGFYPWHSYRYHNRSWSVGSNMGWTHVRPMWLARRCC